MASSDMAIYSQATAVAKHNRSSELAMVLELEGHA